MDMPTDETPPLEPAAPVRPGIAPLLREIGRGKDGARDLTREQAGDVMARILDGAVRDLELGAFAIAMRIKGESPAELAGFMDAVVPRMTLLPSPGAAGAVVLPSYNGARKLPNLVPLLAALLARRGLGVLVHGLEEDPGRVTTAAVFDALGWPIARDAAGVDDAWRHARPSFMGTDHLHPSLTRLLNVRRVIGLRNPAHSLAKLLPAVPGSNAVRVVNHTHPAYADSLGEFLRLTEATALLMRGTEGEPVADARRCPRLAAYVRGVADESLTVEAQGGSLAVLPDLPKAIDATTTARFIETILAGGLPVPAPIETQVETLQRLAQAA
jgi:anthranilate phosphoribosyltransferase